MIQWTQTAVTTVPSNTITYVTTTLPTTFSTTNFKATANMTIGSSSNWARTGVLISSLNVTTVKVVFYCHDYKSVTCASLIAIGT